jgi:hypothetical protein
MGDPRALMDHLTAAQNAHDLEGMLTCFHEDYRSEQPQVSGPDVPGHRPGARQLVRPAGRHAGLPR